MGASARAMKTMGFDNLRLVSPLCNHLSERARLTAHGSNDILENAVVFNTLQESLFDISLTIGSAAKKRSVAHDYHLLEDIPGIIAGKGTTLSKVAIVFGGEESGLTNREMSLCDIISTIPMRRKHPSLNLGQAVMVYATYLSRLNFSVSRKKSNKPNPDELQIVRQKAEQILQYLEMSKEGVVYPRIMERLMLLEKDDTNLFHSFCKFFLKSVEKDWLEANTGRQL